MKLKPRLPGFRLATCLLSISTGLSESLLFSYVIITESHKLAKMFLWSNKKNIVFFGNTPHPHSAVYTYLYKIHVQKQRTQLSALLNIAKNKAAQTNT